MKVKKLSSAFVSLILALGLVVIPNSAANAVVEITYSNWQFAEPGRGDKLKALVEEFNTSQNKIRVKTVVYPYASYANTIITQMGAKSGPDVVHLDYDVFLRANQARLLAPTVVKAPKSGFADADKNFIKSGKRYGMVWISSGYLLICNKKLLTAAGVTCPKTYEEFKAAAAATTNPATGQYGYAFRNTMNQTSGWWYDLSNFVYGFGGRWTDAKGNPTINSPLVEKAVTEYKDFYDKKYVPQGITATEYRRMFWEEKIAMTLDNDSLPGIYITGNASIKENLVIQKSPFPKDAHSLILIGVSVNANSKKQKEATQFLNWMASDAIQAKIVDALGSSSGGSKKALPAALLERAPYLAEYQKYAKNGVLILPQGAELATNEIQSIVLTQIDKILRTGVSVKDGLDAAQTAVKDLLGK